MLSCDYLHVTSYKLLQKLIEKLINKDGRLSSLKQRSIEDGKDGPIIFWQYCTHEDNDDDTVSSGSILVDGDVVGGIIHRGSQCIYRQHQQPSTNQHEMCASQERIVRKRQMGHATR